MIAAPLHGTARVLPSLLGCWHFAFSDGASLSWRQYTLHAHLRQDAGGSNSAIACRRRRRLRSLCCTEWAHGCDIDISEEAVAQGAQERRWDEAPHTALPPQQLRRHGTHYRLWASAIASASASPKRPSTHTPWPAIAQTHARISARP